MRLSCSALKSGQLNSSPRDTTLVRYSADRTEGSSASGVSPPSAACSRAKFVPSITEPNSTAAAPNVK